MPLLLTGDAGCHQFVVEVQSLLVHEEFSTKSTNLETQLVSITMSWTSTFEIVTSI